MKYLVLIRAVSFVFGLSVSLFAGINIFADGKFDKFIAKGEYQKAIEYAEKKTPEEKRVTADWYNLGLANEKANNYERAIACYFKAQGAGDSLLYNIALSRAYNSLGQYSQGYLYALKAYKIDRTSDEVKWQMVRANFNLSRWVGINKILDTILEKYPENQEAKKYHGLYDFRMQSYSSAILYLRDYYNSLVNKDSDIAYKIAICAYESNQQSLAVDYLKEILSKDSKNDNARFLLARAYFKDQKYGLALNEYKQLGNKGLIENEDYYRIAVSNAKNGKIVEAIDAYKTYLIGADKNDTRVIPSKMELGIIYVEKKQYNVALLYLNDVRIAAPSTNGVDVLLAKCYIESGDIDNAILSAKRELYRDSVSVKAYITLIEAYEKKGMKTKANETRVRMGQVCPSNAQVEYELGNHYLNDGRYNDALKSFEKSYILEENPSALEGIAVSSFNLKKYQKAKGASETLLKKDSSIVAVEILYQIAIEEKKYSIGIDCLKSLIKRNPTIKYYTSIALCYLKINDMEKLYQVDELILGIDPLNAESLERLAFARAKQNKHKDAIGYFDRLVACKKVSDVVYYQMYRSSYAVHDTIGAIKNVRKYLEIDGNDINTLKELANLYYDLKSYDNALVIYQRLDSKSLTKGFYRNYAKIIIGKGVVDDILSIGNKAVENGEADYDIYSNIGVIYKRLKDYKKAKWAYGEASKIDVKDVDALQNVAECQLALGEVNDAIVSFEQVVAIKKESKNEYKLLGQLYLKISKKEESVMSYKKYLGFEKDADIAKMVATFEFSKKNFKEAKKYYEMVDITLLSGNAISEYLESCYQQKDYVNTIKSFSVMSEKVSTVDSKYFLMVAISYENQKDIKNAVKNYVAYSEAIPDVDIRFKMASLQESLDSKASKVMYEKNKTLFPKDPRNFLRLGYIYANAKDTLNTRKNFEGAIALTDSIEPSIWITMIDIYRKNKNVDKEMFALKELLKRDPQNFEGNKRLGWMLYDIGKEKEGLIYLELARSQNINDADILFALSHIYYKDGKKPEAIMMLQAAKKLKPNNCEVRHYLLNIYIDINSWEEAKREIEDLLKFENSKENQLVYAEILVQGKRYDRAVEVVKEMRKKEPSNTDLLMYLAHVYKTAKRFDDAIEAHKMVSYIEDQNAQSHYERAEVLTLMSQPDEARVYYLKALEVDNKFAMAEFGLALNYKYMSKMAEYETHLKKAYALDPKNERIIAEVGRMTAK